METFLKDKKINISIFVLIIILSLFTVAKLVNEVKSTDESKMVKTISVEGSGEVSAISDIASLNINLTKDGKTAKEAQDLLNESITKTLTYLKGQAIEDKDIKSEYGGLSPKYSYEKCYIYPCTSDPKIIGYTATQSIVVKVRVVDNASAIRTGLAEIGITDISGPTFSIDDEEGFKDEARAKAIGEAREKAKVLAKDLGVRLGKVVNFSENNGGGYPMYSAKSVMMDSVAVGASATPTLPKGENKITSNVTITYEIK